MNYFNRMRYLQEWHIKNKEKLSVFISPSQLLSMYRGKDYAYALARLRSLDHDQLEYITVVEKAQIRGKRKGLHPCLCRYGIGTNYIHMPDVTEREFQTMLEQSFSYEEKS